MQLKKRRRRVVSRPLVSTIFNSNLKKKNPRGTPIARALRRIPAGERAGHDRPVTHVVGDLGQIFSFDNLSTNLSSNVSCVHI